MKRLRQAVPALAGIVLVLAAAGHVLFAQAGDSSSIHAVGTDDAYITFRYAENLVRGHGLVFNPGERVEGYTNLLFVLISALLYPLTGRDSLYLVATAVCIAALALAFLAFWRHARWRLGEERAWIAAWLLALCPPIWAWAWSGLETILVLSLQVALWIVVERIDREPTGRLFPALCATLSLVVLARADGFILLFATVAFLVLCRRFRLAFHVTAVVGPVVAGCFLWRLFYYGKLLPNTYYVKVSGPLGQRLYHAASQLYDLAISQGLLIYILLVIVMALPFILVRSVRLPFGIFLSLSILLYWIYVGGDHFGERFLLILFPIGIVAFLELFKDLRGRRQVAFLAILALAFQLHPFVKSTRFFFTQSRYDGWITLGKYLAENYSDELLAVDAAGKIPFFSGLPAIDMRGLTDAHIASLEVSRFRRPGHDKFDPDYVISKRPGLIATWIRPSLDAAAGLDRKVYEEAGYSVRLLVNASPKSLEENVVDARGLSAAELRRRIRDGYALAVLER